MVDSSLIFQMTDWECRENLRNSLKNGDGRGDSPLSLWGPTNALL